MIHDLECLSVHGFVLVFFSETEVEIVIESNRHSEEVRRMER